MNWKKALLALLQIMTVGASTATAAGTESTETLIVATVIGTAAAIWGVQSNSKTSS
jgi:hypothetical protein